MNLRKRPGYMAAIPGGEAPAVARRRVDDQQLGSRSAYQKREAGLDHASRAGRPVDGNDGDFARSDTANHPAPAALAIFTRGAKGMTDVERSQAAGEKLAIEAGAEQYEEAPAPGGAERLCKGEHMNHRRMQHGDDQALRRQSTLHVRRTVDAAATGTQPGLEQNQARWEYDALQERKPQPTQPPVVRGRGCARDRARGGNGRRLSTAGLHVRSRTR
ncbi:MAG: hypothetical protein HY270_08140 [Deltaproteobacteria bacterium]|nr:hypothetical protein [Deltaproteobacteria bacterium]